jgi:hypothetical protein
VPGTVEIPPGQHGAGRGSRRGLARRQKWHKHVSPTEAFEEYAWATWKWLIEVPLDGQLKGLCQVARSNILRVSADWFTKGSKTLPTGAPSCAFLRLDGVPH